MSKQAVIYKYSLILETGTQTLRIPGVRPKVRHVAVVDGEIKIWIEVDPSEGLLMSNFKIVATGESYTAAAWGHVGTVLMHEGAFVWHVLQAVKI